MKGDETEVFSHKKYRGGKIARILLTAALLLALSPMSAFAAPKDIDSATVTAIPDQTYTGSAITPTVTVKDGDTTLVKDTDYTVSYADNVNVGTATVTITGAGSYTGTKTATFTIVSAVFTVKYVDTAGAVKVARAFSAAELSELATDGKLGYLYNKTTWQIVGTDSHVALGDLFAASNLPAGTWAAGKTLSFSAFDGAYTKYYPAYEEVSADLYFYGDTTPSGSLTGEGASAPAVIALKSGKAAVVGTAASTLDTLVTNTSDAPSFLFGFANTTPTQVGGNRFPSKIDSVTITRNFASVTVTPIADQAYTGSAITPEVTVKDGSTTFVKDTDYTVAYADNVNVGTATVTLTGKGNYTGTKTVTFSIKQNIASTTVDAIPDQTRTGSAITPAVTVKDGDTTLVKDTDYTVSYADNVNVGTATVTITGAGSYAGTKTATFNIVPAVLTVKYVDATGAVKVAKAFSASELSALATSGKLGYLYYKSDAWQLIGTDSHVALSDLFAASSLPDGTWAANKTLSFSASDGAYTKYYPTYEELSASLYFYGDTTPSGSLTGEGSPAPAVIALKSGVTAVAGTAADTLASLVTGTSDTPRFLFGFANTTPTQTGGNKFPSKIDTITITRNFADATVTPIADQFYTGSAITPTVTVKDGDTTLVKDTDYTVTYTNNVNIGTATATITGKGNYTGTKTATFTIKMGSSEMPVYRFYNQKNGSHFYTASAEERDIVNAKWSSTYKFEGVAYSVNAANPDNNAPLYRFYNVKNGSHFYTASEDEKNIVIAKWSAIYQFEGVAYYVCATPKVDATPVYRFYNKVNGSHFYTASAEERDIVSAKWPSTYSSEGAAFWLAK
ncbi:MAG: hypothetical protein AB2L09_09975 [Coriobacteriia bacterium]